MQQRSSYKKSISYYDCLMYTDTLRLQVSNEQATRNSAPHVFTRRVCQADKSSHKTVKRQLLYTCVGTSAFPDSGVFLGSVSSSLVIKGTSTSSASSKSSLYVSGGDYCQKDHIVKVKFQESTTGLQRKYLQI